VAPSTLIRFLGVPPKLLANVSRSERDRVMEVVRKVHPLSSRFAGIDIDSAPDLHEAPLNRIAAPTLIVSARDDLFNTAPAAEFAARNIAGAKLIVYERGGHLLVGHGPEVRATIREFVNKSHLSCPSADARLSTSAAGSG
jgi:2-hydroxy-6-oxonona-2,4-dienedioate hydrolase